jgi:hypothetical protein
METMMESTDFDLDDMPATVSEGRSFWQSDLKLI